MQSAPQVIPAGADVTVPVPVPVTATVSNRDCSVKVAVTLAACVMLTTHEPVPVHPPPAQPANVDDDAGDAVSVTCVPDTYSSVQSVPHVMPAGADVTVPVPVPASTTVNRELLRSNVAVALTALDPAATTHVTDEPLHAPDQLANVELAFGVAVNVTTLDALSVALHAPGHEMATGDEATVPLPAPAVLTVTVRVVGVGVGVGAGADVSPPEHPANRTAAVIEAKSRSVTARMIVRSEGKGLVLKFVVSVAADRGKVGRCVERRISAQKIVDVRSSCRRIIAPVAVQLPRLAGERALIDATPLMHRIMSWPHQSILAPVRGHRGRTVWRHRR